MQGSNQAICSRTKGRLFSRRPGKKSLLRCIQHNDAYLTLGIESCPFSSGQKTRLPTLEQYHSRLALFFVPFLEAVATLWDPLGPLLSIATAVLLLLKCELCDVSQKRRLS